MMWTLALALCAALLLPTGRGNAQEYDMNIVTGGASGIGLCDWERSQ